jgi:hypothetical protein
MQPLQLIEREEWSSNRAYLIGPNLIDAGNDNVAVQTWSHGSNATFCDLHTEESEAKRWLRTRAVKYRGRRPAGARVFAIR